MGSVLKELKRNPFWPLLIALPVAIGMKLSHSGELPLFIVSAIAIIPLAGLMGNATEALACRVGPSIGGLLNATFGNAAELIIGIMALRKGPAMYPLVKASLTGSIIGNFLLVSGAAMLAGGLKHDSQKFNPLSVSTGTTLLLLAAIGLVVPTIFYILATGASGLSNGQQLTIDSLSLEIAIVLAISYLLSLVFSLVTHRDLFQGAMTEEKHPDAWNTRTAIMVLVLATAGIGLVSEFLSDSVAEAAVHLGMNQIFVGAIVIAVVGNAAEHSTAVIMAMKNDMETALQISIGSATQIALFVAPVLVFSSYLMGHPHPLDLHFSPLEIVAIIASVGIVSLVAQDGETNWMEGVMLLAVYVIFGLAFYHFPYVR